MTPLFRSLLADDFDRLPAPIREPHDRRGDCAAAGRCRIELGRTRLALILARLMLLPSAAGDVSVTVSFTVGDGGETWRRNFGGAMLTSRLRRGEGALAGLLIERRFPVATAIRLVADARGVVYEPVRGWLFGLPLPSWLRPQVAARESVVDGNFQFDVEIGAPLVGRIIRYRGWLRPVSAEKPVRDLAPGNQARGAPAE